jgi:hypothetical protein
MWSVVVFIVGVFLVNSIIRQIQVINRFRSYTLIKLSAFNEHIETRLNDLLDKFKWDRVNEGKKHWQWHSVSVVEPKKNKSAIFESREEIMDKPFPQISIAFLVI